MALVHYPHQCSLHRGWVLWWKYLRQGLIHTLTNLREGERWDIGVTRGGEQFLPAFRIRQTRGRWLSLRMRSAHLKVGPSSSAADECEKADWEQQQSPRSSTSSQDPASSATDPASCRIITISSGWETPSFQSWYNMSGWLQVLGWLRIKSAGFVWDWFWRSSFSDRRPPINSCLPSKRPNFLTYVGGGLCERVSQSLWYDVDAGAKSRWVFAPIKPLDGG